ncbi:MAG: hypothetical protein ACE5OQ_03695 [Woeseia sp.]
MFKTFNLGIVLGIALAALALYSYPVVDQHRERSLIKVYANRGNSESFHIKLPDDRIMVGIAGLAEPIPPGLEWPDYDFLKNIRTELFKVRNEKGIVIGVASRMYGSSELHGSFVEWTVHLPARGSMFVTMAASPAANGYRAGTLSAGTREFLTLSGAVTERFVSDKDDPDSDVTGRIELVAALVGPAVDYE